MRGTDEQVTSGYDIAHEREFYKYFRPFELGLTSAFDAHGGDYASSLKKRASTDRALTAFAQLATLRLNCRRSFISFFDRENQYVLAEATKSLSLGTEHATESGDELKYGTAIFPRSGCFCQHTVEAAVINKDTNARNRPIFVVPDCQKDDRYRYQHYTTHSGFRFYAGVAIVSPDGYTIGSYCVVDDKPRKGLSDDEVTFMKDMATTVMVHMENLRSKSESAKGDQMVHALGSFFEGKSAVEDWWMGDENHNTNATNTSDSHFNSSRGWANKQYSTHSDSFMQVSTGSETPFSIKEPCMPFLDIEDSSDRNAKSDTGDPHCSETSKQDTLSIEVKATFGRATKIIREALKLDGVCCFDAKAGHTFGGLIDQESNERPKRQKMSHDLDHVSEAPESGRSSDSDPDSSEDGEEDKSCEVLGFSTVEYSSIDGDQAKKVTDGMTEKFLRLLLRRYPHGKVISFDENGHSPSGPAGPAQESSDCSMESRTSVKNAQDLRFEEARFIRRIFPRVRSLAIVPLWDSKQQFFSGCVAWTRSAHRVLTSMSELSYLAAFGDSIMAEVSRVDAKLSDKAKSDFISSISHELRSPLHGILGSVECLQDSALDAFQENMVHTVETCGKTLLDTIDHLLDFAKINNFTRKGKKQGRKDKNQNISLDVNVDLSVITEEVLETVFAGHDFMRSTSNGDDNDGGPMASSATSMAQQAQELRKETAARGTKSGLKKLVSVVVDINKAEQSHWIFRTQAGAWRRILMNLFGNSLKYTETGFIEVKLDAAPLPAMGESSKSTVILTVTDSGRGIAKEYLDNCLFKPFAQEDSMQAGTGLGLAITAAIIRSMGGTIDVKSEKGHGTQTTVTLTMTHAPLSQGSLEQNMISNAARQSRGLRIGFVGFEADSFKDKPEKESRSPDNAQYEFMSSFHRLCQNWFGMEMVILHNLDHTNADIFLTTEQGLEQVQAQLDKRMHKQSDKDAQSMVAKIPLLVMCNSATTANTMLHNSRRGQPSDIAEYISQPCGPRKLAKSLVLCLERLKASKHPKTSMPTLHEALEATGDTHERRDRRQENRAKESSDNDPFRGHKVNDNPKANDPPLRHPSDDTMDIDQDMKIEPKAQPSKLSAPRKDVKPRHVRNVLLVDDNKINLQLLVTYVKRSGHTYATATNGVEALEVYKDICNKRHSSTDRDRENKDSSDQSSKNKDQRCSPFDFVLMDLSMPVMDGLTSTRHIRGFERDNNIKPTTVIALTGLASTDAQQEAYSSGINTFMTKPVKLKELSTIFEKGPGEDSEGDGSQ